MNKGQKILIAIAILLLDVFLFGGAYFHAYYSAKDYLLIDAFSKDVRVYLAILLTVIGGGFSIEGEKA
jgi:hypothetical protein